MNYFRVFEVGLLLAVALTVEASALFEVGGFRERSGGDWAEPRTIEATIGIPVNLPKLPKLPSPYKVIGNFLFWVGIYEKIQSQFYKYTKLGEDPFKIWLRGEFKNAERNLVEVQNDVQFIHREIEKLKLIGYGSVETNIKSSLSSLNKYLDSNSDAYLDQFFSYASRLEYDLETLLGGLLGQHTVNADILATTRDALSCHPRKLEKIINSYMAIVNSGWITYATYSQLKNITDSENFSFRSKFNASYAAVEKRLAEESWACRDEKNVAEEINQLIRTFSRGASTAHVQNTVIEYLKDKYDTKDWIVVVTNKNVPPYSRRSHILTSGINAVSDVSGKHVLAVSMDRPAFRNLDTVKSFNLFYQKTASRLRQFYGHTQLDVIFEELVHFLGPLADGIEFAVIDTFYSSIPALSNTEDALFYWGSIEPLSSKIPSDRWRVLAVPKPFKSALAYNCSDGFRDVTSGDWSLLRNGLTDMYLTTVNGVPTQMSWRSGEGQLWQSQWQTNGGLLVDTKRQCLTLGKAGLFRNYFTLGSEECNPENPRQHWMRINSRICSGHNDPHLGGQCLTSVEQQPLLMTTNALTRASAWYEWHQGCEGSAVREEDASADQLAGNPLRNQYWKTYLTVFSCTYDAKLCPVRVQDVWVNSAEQNWRFINGRLVNRAGQCATVRDSFTRQVQSLECTAHSRGQLWAINESGQVVNDFGKCLTIVSEEGRLDNPFVIQDTCKSDGKQIWSQLGANNKQWHPKGGRAVAF